MAETTDPKTRCNRVDHSYDGRFHALWRGRVVYENGHIKRFQSEREAWDFLARCDALGKVATS